MKKYKFLLLSVFLPGIFWGFAQKKAFRTTRANYIKTKPPVFSSLFDGKTLNGWTAVPEREWTVSDSAIAMTGTDRGFIYTNNTYSSYRVIFSVRQVRGVNHWPCELIFGYDPKLDAMGAVQFQLPKDWTWDYRPGKNNDGKPFFSFVGQVPDVSKTEWARCEILVDAATGTARTAVAQPLDKTAIEVTDFKDTSIRDIPTPFGFQSHNKGQYDEFKDIIIEVNPKVNELLTVLQSPTGLKAKVVSGSAVSLSWNDNTAVEDGYKIEKSADNIKWDMVVRLPANASSYTHVYRRGKMPMYYRVSAFNAAANSAYITAAVSKQ